MKILVADDDRDLAHYIALVARERGHTVIETLDGAEALGLAVAERPDVIALDVRLPRLDGRDVIIRLKRDLATRHALVVIITGGRDPQTRELLESYGADAFYLKPFSAEFLVDEIERLVQRRPPAP